jgi:two-component sensor histidine kinase
MKPFINVLYVDDNPLDRELVRDALEKEHEGFRVTEASSRRDFEFRLQDDGFDLVLSDFNILGFEGLQVIEAVKCRDPNLPVIIVTGTGSEEIAVEAMRCGAADYVIKNPHHIQRLPITIHAVLEKLQLQREKARAEETIKASLQEKEVLLREIYHRTKNNMQVICSLLKLQSSRFSDPQVLQAFLDTGNRIRSMALVHEKLYKSNDMSNLDLSDYIKDLAYFLLVAISTENEKITLHFDLHPVIVNIETAMPCGLLVNELISNAIKYAFPEGRKGTISICLRPTTDRDIELRVADDGVGLPPDLDIWHTNSLGFKLITSIGQNQLKGKFEVHRDQGTEFCITFRELDYQPRV